MKNTTLGYIEFDNCFLMLYRGVDKKDGSLGKWLGIGGKLEKGETADECFIREVYEETGIVLSSKDIHRRGIVDFKSSNYEDERMFLYTATASSDYIKPDCNEGNLEWINKSEIHSLNMWEGDFVFLNKLLSDNSFFVFSLIYDGENGDELKEIIEDKLILTDIDSLTDDRVFLYTGLNENNLKHVYEPAEGVFIAETPVVIERAIENCYEPESFLCEHKLLFDLAKYSHIDVPKYSAKSDVLCELTGYGLTHGMLSVMRRKKLLSLDELLEQGTMENNAADEVMDNNEKREIRKIAVLENVMNPANTGAIVRSAVALNVDAIIFTKGAADPLYRRAIRVSMGNIFDMPYTIVNGQSWVDTLKDKGYKIVSTALSDKTKDINAPEIQKLKNEKIAICFGTESTGISNELLDASDYIVKIPMSKNVDSLNVAAASAVIFYSLCV